MNPAAGRNWRDIGFTPHLTHFGHWRHCDLGHTVEAAI